MHVHSVLGPGLLESAYRLSRSRITKARLRLVVESLVIVEMKSVEAVHPVHQAQLLSYMRLSGIGVGLLINFYVLLLRDGIKRLVVG
jgi:GxxExxY protein